MRLLLTIALAVLGAAPAAGAEIPGAEIVLEVFSPPGPGFYPEAAPPRFVMTEKGQVFVGGTSALSSGQLESSEVKRLEKRVERVRKSPALAADVRLGPGATRYRLHVSGKRGFDVTATGDLESAPSALQPLASLLADLASFDHPSLRHFRPQTYALLAREGSLAGGCRAWTLPVALAEAASAARSLEAAAAADWPKGAYAASVCAGGKRYVVTLRPLLPGERP
jgi:hypothetical protein